MPLSLPEPVPGQPPGFGWRLVPPLMQHAVTPLGRALGRSWRVRLEGLEHVRTARRQGPVIVTTWHGFLIPYLWALRDRGISSLVSPVWEGELIARALLNLNFRLVRGSDGYNPVQALRKVVRELRAGRSVATVPDGPEGPARQVKLGVIEMAAISGAPILPLLGAAKWALHLPTWDRQQIPLPGSALVIAFAEPIFVPRDARRTALQSHAAVLKDRMSALERRVSNRLGREVTGS